MRTSGPLGCQWQSCRYQHFSDSIAFNATFNEHQILARLNKIIYNSIYRHKWTKNLCMFLMFRDRFDFYDFYLSWVVAADSSIFCNKNIIPNMFTSRRWNSTYVAYSLLLGFFNFRNGKWWLVITNLQMKRNKTHTKKLYLCTNKMKPIHRLGPFSKHLWNDIKTIIRPFWGDDLCRDMKRISIKMLWISLCIVCNLVRSLFLVW